MILKKDLITSQYAMKNLKTKVRFCSGKINTNFLDDEFSKQVQCI